MMQKQRNGRLSLQTKKNNIMSLQTRKNKGLQDKSNIKPISLSFQNKNLSGFNKTTFDARDKIAAAKRPNDARDKLAAKAKLSDARMKIQQNKNKQNNNRDNSGKVIITGLGKTFKTINTEVKTNSDFTRTINSGGKTNTGFTRTVSICCLTSQQFLSYTNRHHTLKGPLSDGFCLTSKYLAFLQTNKKGFLQSSLPLNHVSILILKPL